MQLGSQNTYHVEVTVYYFTVHAIPTTVRTYVTAIHAMYRNIVDIATCE